MRSWTSLFGSPFEAPRLIGRIETDDQGRYELEFETLRPLLGSVAELSSTWMWLWPQTPDKRIGGEAVSLTTWLRSPHEDVDFVIGELDHYVLEGHVLDDLGQPVMGALVEMIWGEQDFQTYTDADGFFSLATTIPLDLAPRDPNESVSLASIRVSTSHCSAIEETLDPHRWRSRVVQLGRFALEPVVSLATISGRAEAVDGQLLPNWPIFWESSEWSIGTYAEWKNSETVFTDIEGSFAFDGFEEPGALSLESHGQRAEVWTWANGPQSGVVLQLQRPSAELTCKDPEGHNCSPPTRWEFFEQGGFVSVTEHDEFPRSAFGSRFEGDREYLVFPRGGTYRARATWSGYRGTWRVDQEFEIRHQHQQVELHAEYEPHPSVPKGD